MPKALVLPFYIDESKSSFHYVMVLTAIPLLIQYVIFGGFYMEINGENCVHI